MTSLNGQADSAPGNVNNIVMSEIIQSSHALVERSRHSGE